MKHPLIHFGTERESESYQRLHTALASCEDAVERILEWDGPVQSRQELLKEIRKARERALLAPGDLGRDVLESGISHDVLEYKHEYPCGPLSYRSSVSHRCAECGKQEREADAKAKATKPKTRA